MSGERKSGVFKKGLFNPVELKLEAKELGNNLWEIHYEEVLDNVPEQVLKDSKKMGDLILQKVGGKISIEGNKISYTIKGTINQVASIIIGEFMSLSQIGNMTLRDMMVLSGLGTISLKKLETADKKS